MQSEQSQLKGIDMCTRILNNYNAEFVSTARNMDWVTPLPTQIFTFKKGLAKTGGQASDNCYINWTSKYDSVVAMVGNEYACASSDGMNSEGLVANVLYDSSAKFPFNGTDNPPSLEKLQYGYGENALALDVLRWVQYVLDTCRDVPEVVQAFNGGLLNEAAIPEIILVGSNVPGAIGNVPASMHLSVSDRMGRSAIIEVGNSQSISIETNTKEVVTEDVANTAVVLEVDNKVYQIYQSPEYRVMTNEPSYPTQILLNQYVRWQWSDKNNFPSHTLPGGPFPSDRFSRASYYLNHLNHPKDENESLAQSRSIVANACVPIGFSDQSASSAHPNIAPTIWSTYSDHRNGDYYFSNAQTPDVCWVKLSELSELPSVAKLVMVTQDSKNISASGCINEQLKTGETQDPFCIL